MSVQKRLYVSGQYNIVYVRKWTYCIYVQPQNCLTKMQVVMKMECPYLSAVSDRRICRLMVGQRLDGELDDFDISHYCKGNPNYCFFFRSYSSRTQVTGQPEKNEPKKPNVPIVSIGSIVLNEPIQPDEPSSKQSDKLLKLKRFLHRII